MRILDLTRPIESAMPVFPGTEPPTLRPANTIEKDGFAETLLSFYSHTGTHMDAPAHIFKGAPTLDIFPAGRFVGTALVLDCTGIAEIGLDILHRAGPALESAEFLLFYTGWAKKWGTPAYFEGYPCLSAAAADFIVSAGKKGVGFDAVSADPVADESLPIHRRLLASGQMVIVENLKNLDQISPGLFTFFALPLKFVQGDGAPVRAIAMFD
ncbi:MAG: cyclase family protein [Candidatus Pelethousia sp.]|nr:cyclase family protein [Candidatus Pelethousia sp.]